MRVALPVAPYTCRIRAESAQCLPALPFPITTTGTARGPVRARSARRFWEPHLEPAPNAPVSSRRFPTKGPMRPAGVFADRPLTSCVAVRSRNVGRRRALPTGGSDRSARSPSGQRRGMIEGGQRRCFARQVMERTWWLRRAGMSGRCSTLMARQRGSMTTGRRCGWQS
jgi:hypothetical protein